MTFVHHKSMEAIKMKKLIMSLMCLGMLVGCGNDKTTTDNRDNTTPNENVTNKTEDNRTNDTTWLDNFETGLKGGQVNYSTKSALDATSIGGAEGYRYVTDNGNIDVYRFEDGEALERIKKEKTVTIDGKPRKVEVKDHMVIVVEGLGEDILNIFRGL